MIEYRKLLLSNGLTVLAHEDHSTPVAAFNLMYDVGARDEHPEHTGFAHLFEHLMFGGSVNIPDFDKPLQERGGVSNAFTNNDITNYYITIPAQNVETAFWLDSDRMLSLAFSEKSLEVQRQVVTEEFRQRYLNQPYGDVWLHLRPLAYKVHPYQWPTIGKKVEHITTATMQQVRDFFFKHYTPANAILCVAGPFSSEFIFAMAEKWFGNIEKREKYIRNVPAEPQQTEARKLELEREVPSDMIYKVWHMPARNEKGFYACDLMSDVLSRGKSSRLYRELVQEKKMFSEVSAYVSGDLDKGLLVISGRPAAGIKAEDAARGVDEVLNKLKSDGVHEEEMEKIVNKWIVSKQFDDMNVLSKAMNLCYFELLGDAGLINTEMEKYKSVTGTEIKKITNEVLREENSCTLLYKSKK